MQVFKSKSDTTIEAFQFNGTATSAPDWFYDYLHIGQVQVTVGSKQHEDVITIYQDNQEKKVFNGEWLCRNNQKNLYKLTNEEMLDGFEKVFDM